MGNTFVLVTGAWHGGWAWKPVADVLRAQGHTVYAPTLPGLSHGEDPRGFVLRDCARSVVDLIERENLQDVILVGHSWGGYPITEAAHDLDRRLRTLVYWSAFVPGAGASLHDEVPPQYQELFAAQAASSTDNTVALPLEVWSQAFMNDATEESQRIIHSLMVPHPYQYFTEPVEPFDAAKHDVDVSYLLGEQDIALPPGEYGWRRFAERLGVEPRLVPGSHESCFTQPKPLAEALMAVTS